MTDQEEAVRTAAYVGQALVLQNVCGVELAEAQTAEITDPVGDRQKNVFYRKDFESDAAFEEAKNFNKLLQTPGQLAERYREIYTNKHDTCSVQQYATQFRRDLNAVT